ncbi:ADP-L-glycero-D-manno-heptose-6-epimerase [Methanocaldococcus vulcanius M7]|uniref:ADP-L-glycero-D-manno-heptose-6-epimerase n=1 Tax=Methanocaldococcus vulcanius (strain ATCC 700851 / DSM 12094 / M7) TaxID=579137 RepID=C9RED9_METVM|nr:ADP-glyceromanno-heptose 6-epimerase [Methanocaldococcus vulcanius]ACX71941.1 ADP-L-glycero-D-manno-heptose-6-epimerase [Methanocaldococcus vulcanius M7]
MKVLVTGGAGFIGSNLALELQNKGYDVVVLDDFSSGHFKNLLGFEGDVVAESILDVDLSRFRDVDVIFHQAAITDTTVQDQKLMVQINTEGFRRFLDFAVENNIKFVYASSAATYGNAPAPQKEEDAGKPNNIYGFSKWICDCIAKKYIEKYPDAHIVGLRYFNVFGPREQYKGKMASMIWQLAKQMVDGKRPRIFKWGEQKRDQVYIKDVVGANLLAVDAKKSCIVNVGSGRAVSFNYIIEVLNKVLGFDYEPEYIDNPYKEFYQEHTEADLSKAEKYLDYKPKWGFEEAVEDYMEWLKENKYI